MNDKQRKSVEDLLGWAHLLLAGGKHPSDAFYRPNLDMTRAERGIAMAVLSPEAVAWLDSDEIGESAATIFAHATCVFPDEFTDGADSHPYDGDDFRRCALLLEQVPEARLGLVRLAARDAGWSRLYAIWDRVVAALDNDCCGDWRDADTEWHSNLSTRLIRSIFTTPAAQ